MTQQVRGRRWKRWLACLVILLLLLATAIAALPFALSTPPAKRWLLARANRELAPARLEVGAIQFSWFSPTYIRGVALIDAEGDRVLSAPRAIWDPTLKNWLFDHPRYGTL